MMPINIKIFTSDELFYNKTLFKDYVKSFNKTFKCESDISFFRDKYKSKDKFSLHVISLLENKIIGGFTVIPRQTYFNDKIKISGMCCDTFVLKEHRSDELLLKKMFDFFIKNNHYYSFDIIFGIPNIKASLYWGKLVKWKSYGEFKIQIIPSNFLKLKPFWVLLPILISPIIFLFDFIIPKPEVFLLRDEDFINNRFKKHYKIENRKHQIFSKIYTENNLKINYLFGIENIHFFSKIFVLMSILLRDKSDFLAIGSNKSILPFFKIPSFILKRKMNLMYFKISSQNYINQRLQINMEFFDNR